MCPGRGKIYVPSRFSRDDGRGELQLEVFWGCSFVRGGLLVVRCWLLFLCNRGVCFFVTHTHTSHTHITHITNTPFRDFLCPALEREQTEHSKQERRTPSSLRDIPLEPDRTETNLPTTTAPRWGGWVVRRRELPIDRWSKTVFVFFVLTFPPSRSLKCCCLVV